MHAASEVSMSKSIPSLLKQFADHFLRYGWEWAFLKTTVIFRVIAILLVGIRHVGMAEIYNPAKLYKLAPVYEAIRFVEACGIFVYIAVSLFIVKKLWPRNEPPEDPEAAGGWRPDGRLINIQTIVDLVFISLVCFAKVDVGTFAALGFALPLMNTAITDEFKRVAYLAIAVIVVLWARVAWLYYLLKQEKHLLPFSGLSQLNLWEIILHSALPLSIMFVAAIGPLYILISQKRKLIEQHNTLKDAESKLDEQERIARSQSRLLQSLVKSLPYIVFAKDLERRFTYASPLLRERVGQPMLTKTDEDFFEKQVVDDYYRVSDEAILLHGKPRWEGFEPHYIKEMRGTRFLFTTKVPIQNEDGSITGLVGICCDPEEETFFGKLTQIIPYAIFWKDKEGRFMYVNDLFCKAVGQPRDKILGRKDEDLFEKVLADFYRACDVGVIDTRINYRNTEEFDYGGKGNIHIVSTIKVPVIDRDDEVSGVMGLFSDVQETRREGEAWLRWLLHDLPKPLAILRDNVLFRIDSAHVECRDILRELRGRGGAVQKLASDANDKMRTIHHQLERAVRLLEMMDTHLATLGAVDIKANDGRFTWRNAGEATTVQPQFEWVTEAMTLDFPGEVQITVEPADLEVRTDFGKLRVVLWVLLENAIKATKERSIKSPPAEWRERIHIHLEMQGEWLALRVMDNGIGVEPRFADVILRGGTSLFKKGAGTGLRVVKHLAKLANGSLTLEKAAFPEGGAAFKFTCKTESSPKEP
ncbi:MAG TPA: PAS domain-containing protein [Chthoniobacter sp.]|nr:PAS domain-containing protein [Chthoniobacter sp.]